MKSFCSIVILTSVIAFIGLWVNAEQLVEVQISNGLVVGKKVVMQQGEELSQFLGIPYARPPVGVLRFRRPQPPHPWNEPLNALEWANNCIQSEFVPGMSALYQSQNFSEDCLYLNVWSPSIGGEPNELREVLVWIHGGGLIIGGSSFFLYDGQTLSTMANAVVVSINYRLSTLGYLYSDEVADVQGNQGFWDQTMALQWIQDNIHLFGGNPHAVTIFGESAGSWSVSAHILSPVSRHLFQNAIMLSGSVTFNIVDNRESIVSDQLKGIRAVGCASESDVTISQQVVECLQNLEPNKVDTIYYLSGLPFHRIAVVDGEFFPSSPEKMLEEGNHKHNFNLLVSTVEDEGSFMLYLGGLDLAKFRQTNPESLSLDEAQEFLFQLASQQFPMQKLDKTTISKIYFNGLNGNFDKANLFRKQVGLAVGDWLLACPTFNFAKSLFRSSPDTISVYQWHYKAKMGNLKLLCSEWGGTCHMDDLYAVFGESFRNRHLHLNRERDISREVIDFIAAFIRNGTPGNDHQEWQSYFMATDGLEVVAPYYEISNEAKKHSSFKFDLKRAECNVWNNYYE